MNDGIFNFDSRAVKQNPGFVSKSRFSIKETGIFNKNRDFDAKKTPLFKS